MKHVISLFLNARYQSVLEKMKQKILHIDNRYTKSNTNV